MNAAGICLIDDPHDGESCDDPAVATIMFSCVHEHIDQPRCCAACAVDVQQCAGDMICPHCRDGAEPHVCMVRVVIEWDWDGVPATLVQEAA